MKILLLILQKYQHVEVALKIDNETVQVKSLGYNEDIIINHNTKEITINVTNFLEMMNNLEMNATNKQ